MNTKLAFTLLGIVLLVVACGGGGVPSPSNSPSGVPTPPMPTATPEAQRHGIDGLVEDLRDAGFDAEIGDSFDGEPLAVQQTIVCANGQDVRIFVYGTDQEAIAAAQKIDPDAPSNIGTAMVEWDGWPKFWQRDRIIVLYLGRDAPTIGALTTLMGEPFAQGRDQPQRLPGAC